MHLLRLIAPIILFAFLIGSCALFDNGSIDYPEWEEWQNTPPEISLDVQIPKEVARTGSLHYRVTVTNESDKELRIGAGKSLNHPNFEFDLAVVNQDDEMVWVRFPRDSIY